MFHKIEVYGAYYCPYSRKATQITNQLEQNGIFENVIIHMQNDIDATIIEKKMSEPTTRTIPVIFIQKTKNGKLEKIKDGCSGLIEFCNINSIDF